MATTSTPAPQWGPGAANDRNWDTIDDSFTPAGSDQTTNMPTLGSFTLYAITPPLEKEDDFENWLSTVMRVLVSNKLDKFVDDKLERPLRNNPNADTWLQLSRQVQLWLCLSMTQELAESIIRRHPSARFADGFMVQLKKTMRGEGQVAYNRAYYGFMGLRRNDFDNTKEFIDAVQLRHKQSDHHGCGIKPYHAMSKVMLELDTMPHLKGYIGIKKNEMYARKDLQHNATLYDFFTLCVDLTAGTKEIEDPVMTVPGSGIMSTSIAGSSVRSFSGNSNNNQGSSGTNNNKKSSSSANVNGQRP